MPMDSNTKVWSCVSTPRPMTVKEAVRDGIVFQLTEREAWLAIAAEHGREAERHRLSMQAANERVEDARSKAAALEKPDQFASLRKALP